MELEQRVTSIHSLSLCLFGVFFLFFFKAGWSKKADPFNSTMLQPGRGDCQRRGLLGGRRAEKKKEND